MWFIDTILKMIGMISNAGSIEPLVLLGQYFYYPIMHIFISLTEIIRELIAMVDDPKVSPRIKVEILKHLIDLQKE